MLCEYARPRKTAPSADNRILLIPVADLQIGKIDGGGTESTIERFARLTQDIADEIRATTKGKVPAIVLAYAGDCLEGPVSQGGRLVTRLDLSLTEQLRVYRRLLTHQIGVLAPLCDRMLVMLLPGNHDETTRQFAAKPTDSWAIESASAVADALAERAAYSHVTFLFPEDEELAITVNVGTDDVPLIIGLTHGHVCGSTCNQVIPWWTKQNHGRRKVGEAYNLITGHWHHLRIEHTGGDRTWIQAPALDGGSHYWRRKNGDDGPPVRRGLRAEHRRHKIHVLTVLRQNRLTAVLPGPAITIPKSGRLIASPTP